MRQFYRCVGAKHMKNGKKLCLVEKLDWLSNNNNMNSLENVWKLSKLKIT